MKSIFKSPPVILALVCLLLVMVVFVVVTDMPKYMTSSPRTCSNCHVMDAAYENWYHAPHESATKCVDCHLPHDNIFSYYYIKFASGAHDILYFSTGRTPDAIRIKPETAEIIQTNCIRCHTETVADLSAQDMGRDCWACHRDVAHGQRGFTLLPVQDSLIYPVEEERGLE